MPRRYFGAHLERTACLDERLDREAATAKKNPKPKDDEVALDLPALTTDESARYAEGTTHTGTVLERRSAGWVVSFGKIKAILPFSELAGRTNIQRNSRVKSRVKSFDGIRPPVLTLRPA